MKVESLDLATEQSWNQQITNTTMVPEVAFTGDTTPDFILDAANKDALQAKLLIMEVQFAELISFAFLYLVLRSKMKLCILKWCARDQEHMNSSHLEQYGINSTSMISAITPIIASWKCNYLWY